MSAGEGVYSCRSFSPPTGPFRLKAEATGLSRRSDGFRLGPSITQLGPHLERVTADNSQQNRLHRVILRSGATDDGPDDGLVDGLEATAQCVNQHLFGDGPDEDPGPREARVPQRHGSIALGPVRKHAGGVDRQPFARLALPLTDGVEVLQRKPD